MQKWIITMDVDPTLQGQEEEKSIRGFLFVL